MVGAGNDFTLLIKLMSDILEYRPSISLLDHKRKSRHHSKMSFRVLYKNTKMLICSETVEHLAQKILKIVIWTDLQGKLVSEDT